MGNKGCVWRKDLTGMKFGRLTVISYSHTNKNRCPFWNCKCECGNELKINGASIKSGHTKSCGCLNKEVITTHKLSKTRVYVSWNAMIQRCTNVKSKQYRFYGGRGISVCEKWLSFDGFYEDMGDRPAGMSIDRINSFGDYCKENCKWSTIEEQSNNKITSIKITHQGKTQTLTLWAKEIGINHGTLRNRIIKRNWSIEKAFYTKVRKKSVKNNKMQ